MGTFDEVALNGITLADQGTGQTSEHLPARRRSGRRTGGHQCGSR